MENKKKKIIIYTILLFITLIISVIGFIFAKYKSDTPHKIIQLFTKYNINYQTNLGKIKEPEKFNSYYSINGLTLPVEGEISRVGQDFAGWYRDNNFTGTAVTKVEKGEWGDKLFFAAWHPAQYDLKTQTRDLNGNIVAGLPEGYEIVIGKDDEGNDNVIKVDGEKGVTVGKNETVSIRVPYSEDASSSGLSFSDENISLTMRYKDGEQYIYYDFYMPRKNLTITYDVSNDMSSYIDISKSPIIFEENVSISDTSLTKNGFWYKSPISGMVALKTDEVKGNFYEWDYSKPFYVTSKNKETQNQLVLVNSITVYFKDCNMVATDSYTNRLSELTIDGKAPGTYYSSFNAEGSLSNIANVVIDNSLNYKYTTNLYFIGDNIINCISQSKMPDSENYYGNIKLYGTTANNKQSTLYLGSILENGTLGISDLTIKEYSNDTYLNNSSLMFYATAKSSGLGDITINGTSVIEAPNSWAYLKTGTMVFSGNSTGNLKYIYGSQGVRIANNSSLLIQNDLIWGRGLTVSDNGYLVVNGNILDFSHDNSQNPSTNFSTSKYVIVKGNRAEFNNFTMSRGTVIANIISISYSSNYKGGTIVTNQISNYIADVASVNASEGSVNVHQYQNKVTTSPFYTHSSNAPVASKFTFSGGDIYLFGEYLANNSNNNYDLSYTAMTSQNPIGEIINSIGELNSLAVMPSKTYIVDKINSINTINECMVLGNNTYNNDTILREFYLSGTNFYAAGNLNFLNNTYISAGTITTLGNVSSELDLIITGGTLDADKIGNSSNQLYTSPTNKLKRWAKTVISDNAGITTSRIGAITNSDQTRSVVQISGGTIAPKTSNIQVVYDMYLNYSMSSEFTNPASNPSNIRYSGTLAPNFGDTAFKLVNDDLTSLSSITIEAPIESSSALSGWIFKDLAGYVLDSTTSDGYLTYHNQTETVNPADSSNEYVVLYAAKSNYKLTVKEGSNYIAETNVSFSQDNYEANVSAKDTVSIKLNDASMESKTVVWYYDADGILHNVSNFDADLDGTITFTMPRANTEIYITPLLKLYLDEYEIELNDDGFQVELSNTRDDSKFKYSGSYMITQRNTYDKNIDVFTPSTSGSNAFLTIDGVDYKSSDFESYATFNRIKINMSNWDGENTDNITRTITFYKIIQKFNSASDFSLMSGVDIAANKKVAIQIDGINELCFTRLQPTSDIYYYGDNNSTDKIVLQYTGRIQNWSQGFIGNQDRTLGAIGNVLIENLTYLQRGNNVSLAKNSNATSSFTMNNSIVKLYNYYAGSGIAQGFNNVNINNSDVDMYMSGDTSPGPFNGSKTVNINNTMLDYSVGGARNSTSLFYNVTNFNMTGTSNIKIKDVYSKGTVIRNVSDISTTTNVVLRDQASLTAERRIRIPKLSMYDNSSFTVTGLNNDLYGGYLFCSNINMYGGILNADYIILNGYNSVSDNSITTVKEYLQNDQNIVRSGSLTMTGGKVNAHTFIGGNEQTTITLNKDVDNNTTGTLTAKNIGTIDQLYGISYYTPKVEEEYIYTHSKIPSNGATIIINDGTVNVSNDGYLGGMNGKIDVNGGTIHLGENAVIGMNEVDTTKLVNSITSQGEVPSELVDINITGGTILGNNGCMNAPYSTLNINATNSNPSVSVKDILVEHGTVNIKQTSDHYDNPLGQGNRVGIIVNNNLMAQNIELQNGAVVYAKNAIIKHDNTTTSSYLKIDNTSYLYSDVYGTDGVGDFTLDNKGTITGKRQYSINYNMNDTFIDQASNPNSYNYVEGTGFQLADPSRFGYIFKGWYDKDGNKITEISKTDVGNKELTANWEAKTVEFVITTSAEATGLSLDEFKNQIDPKLGEFNEQGDKFTYKEHLFISYHDLLNTKLLLSHYNLSSLSASSAKINNEVINPDGDILNLTSTGATVTKEIMEYHLNNNIPIEISVCEYVENIS